MTNCHQKQMQAVSFDGVAPPGAFVPSCRVDGSFDSVQCQGGTPFCWCVDNDNGIEIPGSRELGKPECDVPRESYNSHATGKKGLLFWCHFAGQGR